MGTWPSFPDIGGADGSEKFDQVFNKLIDPSSRSIEELLNMAYMCMKSAVAMDASILEVRAFRVYICLQFCTTAGSKSVSREPSLIHADGPLPGTVRAQHDPGAPGLHE